MKTINVDFYGIPTFVFLNEIWCLVRSANLLILSSIEGHYLGPMPLNSPLNIEIYRSQFLGLRTSGLYIIKKGVAFCDSGWTSVNETCQEVYIAMLFLLWIVYICRLPWWCTWFSFSSKPSLTNCSRMPVVALFASLRLPPNCFSNMYIIPLRKVPLVRITVVAWISMFIEVTTPLLLYSPPLLEYCFYHLAKATACWFLYTAIPQRISFCRFFVLWGLTWQGL
jgi:hypothetical protein